MATAIALGNMGMSVAASPAETGSGISFVGPTVRELPTELEFLSASPRLTAGFSCYTGTYPSPIERCQAYLVALEDPDPSGLYHFRFNLPAAAPGDVHIEARTPSGGWLAVEITATNSGTVFGDARTCLMPGSNAAGQVAFELGFYSQVSSTAVVFRQKREGDRWASPRLKALANYPVGGPRGFEPYVRRTLRLRVDQAELAAGKVRLLYFLMKGNHPTIGRRQRRSAIRRAQPFSTVACLPPGGT
jgi:hypothetical protein